MLKCENLSVRVNKGSSHILEDISAEFPRASLNALVGPSGCGKTTLIKAFLGLIESDGSILLDGKEQTVSASNQLGFVPQFSVAHSNLTVEESLNYAFKLSVTDSSLLDATLSSVLNLIGLKNHKDKLVSSLSGGQLRRLGLGLEMVSNPDCLICDEVTSGLDPLSEDQIIALLRSLVEKKAKTFICTIHNLGKLPEFDSITVLYLGRLVFQGDYHQLKAWFSIEDPLKLYHALAEKDLDFWLGKWADEKDSIMLNEGLSPRRVVDASQSDGSSDPSRQVPSSLSQLRTLMNRRYRLLMRDTGYLWLLLALTFGFPCIVVIFAIQGLPQIEGLSLERSGSFMQQLQGDLRYQMDAAHTATLVTGLVMFQVVLLTLMGANNGAREIASERQIYEKERLNGLRPSIYALSKLIFTGSIALIQGTWMGLFVKVVCQFPGDYIPQLLMMALCCMAMTFVCLGMSAVLASAERASLLSIYLVGFQLPLSGVVLAVPDTLVWVLRPFINAYWSWAGYFSSMKDFQVYDAYRMGDVSWLAGSMVSIFVLSLHILTSVTLIYFGCLRKRWS